MMEAILQIWPILAFLAVQTFAVTWWAATSTARLNQLEKDTAATGDYGERMVKLEGTLQHIAEKLDELVTAFTNSPTVQKRRTGR